VSFCSESSIGLFEFLGASLFKSEPKIGMLLIALAEPSEISYPSSAPESCRATLAFIRSETLFSFPLDLNWLESNLSLSL